MRQLEADHLAEEKHLAVSGASPNPANGNISSAPTTPPGHAFNNGPTSAMVERPAPIGQGREMANGAKSMPTSRRASGYGGTFGLEKLSLSIMEPGTKQSWADDEDVDAEGAQSRSGQEFQKSVAKPLSGSVKYLGMGDDDPFPGMPKETKVGHTKTELDTPTDTV